MFKKEILPSNLPVHVAFIMDGNRRWAVKNKINKMVGHKYGAGTLKNVIDWLCEIKEIKYASFFAFSTENWSRDKKEIDYIFDVVCKYLEQYEENFIKKNIKLVVMGDISKFSKEFRDKLLKIVDKTKDNSGLVVNLALNYGGRDDIVNAVNKLIEKGVEKITVENLSENLYSAPSPDVDLLIRTSGEFRISNFMLFQLAYSEMYFTKKYWPEFDKKEFYKALREYSKRNRRFGGK